MRRLPRAVAPLVLTMVFAVVAGCGPSPDASEDPAPPPAAFLAARILAGAEGDAIELVEVDQAGGWRAVGRVGIADVAGDQWRVFSLDPVRLAVDRVMLVRLVRGERDLREVLIDFADPGRQAIDLSGRRMLPGPAGPSSPVPGARPVFTPTGLERRGAAGEAIQLMFADGPGSTSTTVLVEAIGGPSVEWYGWGTADPRPSSWGQVFDADGTGLWILVEDRGRNRLVHLDAPQAAGMPLPAGIVVDPAAAGQPAELAALSPGDRFAVVSQWQADASRLLLVGLPAGHVVDLADLGEGATSLDFVAWLP